MSRQLILRKPNNLSLQLIDPYLEMDLDIENPKLENDMSHQIESLTISVLIAYYDIIAFESEELENDDSFHSSQSLID